MNRSTPDIPDQSTRQSHPELSVIILCYRSGKQAIEFAHKTKKIFESGNISDYELVLVGNYHAGADDETPMVIKKLSSEDKKIIAVALPKPKGGMMGWDMRSGLGRASGDYIAIIDGDGQMPIEDLVKVFRIIKDKKLDLVKTYRLTRGDSLWRKFISTAFNLAFIVLFPGLKTRDINSKPKIIRRDKFKELNLEYDDWFIDAEIMIQARRLKFKIGEIPTFFLGLDGKRKSFVKLPAIWEFAKNMVACRIKEFFK